MTKYHFYEDTKSVASLSEGKITHICSFEDCGITPSSSVVLNESDEMAKRVSLVESYLKNQDRKK